MSVYLIKLFVLFDIIYIYGELLDICGDGNCAWNEPDNSHILVCLSTANRCIVRCRESGSCHNIIIYNLSPYFELVCNAENACTATTVYCGGTGDYVPNLGYELYGLTSTDFRFENIDTCYLNAYSTHNNVAKYAKIYCSGSVNNCIAYSGGHQTLNDAILYCEEMNISNNNCIFECEGTNGCYGSSIYCYNTNGTCVSIGQYSNRIALINSSLSPTTQLPTSYPSIIPSKSPIEIPTNMPTLEPTILETIATKKDNTSNTLFNCITAQTTTKTLGSLSTSEVIYMIIGFSIGTFITACICSCSIISQKIIHKLGSAKVASISKNITNIVEININENEHTITSNPVIIANKSMNETKRKSYRETMMQKASFYFDNLKQIIATQNEPGSNKRNGEISNQISGEISHQVF